MSVCSIPYQTSPSSPTSMKTRFSRLSSEEIEVNLTHTPCPNVPAISSLVAKQVSHDTHLCAKTAGRQFFFFAHSAVSSRECDEIMRASLWNPASPVNKSTSVDPPVFISAPRISMFISLIDLNLINNSFQHLTQRHLPQNARKARYQREYGT